MLWLVLFSTRSLLLLSWRSSSIEELGDVLDEEVVDVVVIVVDLADVRDLLPLVVRYGLRLLATLLVDIVDKLRGTVLRGCCRTRWLLRVHLLLLLVKVVDKRRRVVEDAILLLYVITGMNGGQIFLCCSAGSQCLLFLSFLWRVLVLRL